MFTVILMTENALLSSNLLPLRQWKGLTLSLIFSIVHDYHTAMIPFLLKEKYRWIQAYEGIKTVLTIHNLEFQGQFLRRDVMGICLELALNVMLMVPFAGTTV